MSCLMNMFHWAILQLLLFSILHVSSQPVAVPEQIDGQGIRTQPPYSCYQCFNLECYTPFNLTCHDGTSCFTHYEISDGEIIFWEKGCHHVPFVEMVYCNLGITWKRKNETKKFHTCCTENYCNDEEFIIPTTLVPTISSSTVRNENLNILNSTKEIALGNICNSQCKFLPVPALLLLTIYLMYTAWTGRTLKGVNMSSQIPNLASNVIGVCIEDSGRSDGATLNQRSLSQDVTLVKRIGRGRYGEVWQASLRNEDIAVKIFSSVDGASWANEVNIYTNIALYHENLLGFKGSTVTSRLGVTELWLLTAFYEQGSLYDYLLKNTISEKQMMDFLRSISCGLQHLHTEFFGSKGKPPIAHRDLKTRNILVTSHGTCVIADFGLAVVKTYGTSDTQSIQENYRVGTKRYMAPEVLDETMNVNNFESFKRADIYAFGLMMWEVCSRCNQADASKPFRLAFHDSVPSDPDFEAMKMVVCTELKRPEIPDSWSTNEPLDAMARLMRNCWHKNPEVRYTVYRVKKTLDRIHAKMQEQ